MKSSVESKKEQINREYRAMEKCCNLFSAAHLEKGMSAGRPFQEAFAGFIVPLDFLFCKLSQKLYRLSRFKDILSVRMTEKGSYTFAYTRTRGGKGISFIHILGDRCQHFAGRISSSLRAQLV